MLARRLLIPCLLASSFLTLHCSDDKKRSHGDDDAGEGGDSGSGNSGGTAGSGAGATSGASGSTTGGSSAGTSSGVCDPGQVRTCTGADACPGTQECAGDGTWFACDCGSSTGGSNGQAGSSSGAGGGAGNPGGGSGAGGTAAGSGATGGGAGTAGTTGGTGATVECGASFSVGMDGFVSLPAKDGSCWHGYAYANGSTATTITYCGGAATEDDFSNCMGMLNITGTLEEAVDPDYAGYVLIGFSLNEPAGGGTKGKVTPTGTGLVITGTAASGRVQLQAGTTYYCAAFTSGTLIPYTSFNTACWDDSGTAYSKTTPIDTIALQIPGGAAAAAYSIALTSVTEM